MTKVSKEDTMLPLELSVNGDLNDDQTLPRRRMVT